MLGFVGCGECGSVRGTYSKICATCQRRKRRSEQQRNRRSGTPDPTVAIAQSSLLELVASQNQVSALKEYFEKIEPKSEVQLSPRSLTRIQQILTKVDHAMEAFITQYGKSIDPQPPAPVRRYRKRQ